MTRWGTIALLGWCLVRGDSAVAQDIPLFFIEGRVFDVVTREPLPNVNIYLSNTTRGTTTDLEGGFILRNVPAGLYELVCSMVGYQRRTIRVHLTSPQSPLSIGMDEMAIQTGTVDVVAKDPKEWREGLERFKSYFFGNTSNGRRCVLENPEVLEFHVDETTGRFEASASAPLRITNKALGYRMEFALQLFVLDGTLFRYGGTVLFVPMAASDDGENEQWSANRKRAFRGSLKHFLTSLMAKRLAREGFQIAKMHQIPATASSRVPREAVEAGNIVFQDQFEFERRITFDHFLMVEFTEEVPEDGFREFWGGQAGFEFAAARNHQVSWLKLDFPDIRMNVAGNLYDPFSLRTYGYWSFERVGEWLPLDYLPGGSP